MKNRLKKIVITKQAFERVFTEGFTFNGTVTQGIPEGAIVMSMDRNLNTGCLEVVVGHESFEEVGEGDYIPKMTIAITKNESKN